MIENKSSDRALERAVQRLNEEAGPEAGTGPEAIKSEPDYKKEYVALLKRLRNRADGAQAGLSIVTALRGFIRSPVNSPTSHLIEALDRTLYQMSLRSPLVTYQDMLDLDSLDEEG